jgi:transposase
MMRNQKGWPIRALARHFDISRNTVRRILRKHAKSRDEGHDILKPHGLKAPIVRPSKLDPFEKTIRKIMEKYPKITGLRLFEELISAGYDGGISILRDRLRSLRPSPKQTPIIRFETDPGIHYGKKEIMLSSFSFTGIFGKSDRHYLTLFQSITVLPTIRVNPASCDVRIYWR